MLRFLELLGGAVYCVGMFILWMLLPTIVVGCIARFFSGSKEGNHDDEF